MRIDRYLANAGLGSRREVKILIKKKVVFANGILVDYFDYDVSFEDEIIVDGKKVDYQEYYYVLLHKPVGYLSATKDQFHPTVLDLMPEYQKYHISPVGRLDIDTTGVMLLTNHGALSHVLLSPRSHVEKTYLVTVNHPLQESLKEAFEKGVRLDDGYVCMPAKFEKVSSEIARVTIKEGKFHQIKRMFQAFDYEVIRLHREQFDFLRVDDLPLGKYRPLTNEEISQLLEKLKK